MDTHGQEILLDEQKKILLDTMEYIDFFCRENHINYFLISGSLLGAVRHKGFIPWDDDIDIGMLRCDYDRFIEIFNNKKSSYRVVNIDIIKGYYCVYAKVIDTRTVLVEEIKGGIPLGISVDVFPIDNCPTNGDYKSACKFAESINLYRVLLSAKLLKVRKERNILKNIVIILTQIVFAWVSKEWLIRKIDSSIKKYSSAEEVEYVGELAYMPYGARKEIYKKSWLEETIKMPFESSSFNVPYRYDDFLKTTYGDYMKLPPIEERVTHHNYKCWWQKGQP